MFQTVRLLFDFLFVPPPPAARVLWVDEEDGVLLAGMRTDEGRSGTIRLERDHRGRLRMCLEQCMEAVIARAENPGEVSRVVDVVEWIDPLDAVRALQASLPAFGFQEDVEIG